MASSRISNTNDDYDARLKQIQERNDTILGHFVHAWKGRMSDDVLYRHALNIQHFAGWHLNYCRAADELRSVDQVTAWDVYDFITDWLPRKSWVDSERRIKSYLATLKRYVQFMAEHEYMRADVATSILRMIKQDREDMIRAAITYYDEPQEKPSPEAFDARLRELEARWVALARKDVEKNMDIVNQSVTTQKKRKPSKSAGRKA
jgi:hypothetical protein